MRKDGRVQPIGSYPGPGGAENIAIAPAKFGTASGWCLLSIDHDSAEGRLLAIDRKGNVKTIATGLGNGLNPIVVLRAAPKTTPGRLACRGPLPRRHESMQIWFAPAAAFQGFAGSVLVGTELTGDLWVIQPNRQAASTPSRRPPTCRSTPGTSRAPQYVP